ncbi:beta-ketoacyl-ACP synthase III [Streptomyces sp. NPDC058676]|uniref:beta-ketoacyl-ACP synthase III n=1 Tax=unclassified Streptomyces TaxID=2593676 RepID=UPI00364DD52D
MIFARKTTAPSPAQAARLIGLGSYLPPRKVDNADFASRLDTTDEWIRTRIGITERHIADPATATSDLAVEAGLRAMKSASIEHVDAVILATATPDHHVPGTAPLVAHQLGLRQVPAFDLGAGCSGFVFATTVAAGLIHAGTAGTVLVIGAEKMSAVIDPADRSTAPIFGDGAGAVVLRAGHADEPGALGPAAWGSDGEHADAIYIPGGGSRNPSRTTADLRNRYVHMKGNEVFRHAVRRITHVTEESAAAAGWAIQGIDRLIVHQANARISVAVANTLGIPPERVPSNITHVGNTSAASIPLLLSHSAINGQLKPRQRVVVTSFGAGFTWAATTLLWPIGLQVLA